MYRICRRFTVESGHMLSKHKEACRYPHGHSRTIEVVVRCQKLDANDMVLDFKALKIAIGPMIDRFDHRMAVNVADPLLSAIKVTHPDSLIEFDRDPTTEVLAEFLYREVARILEEGFVEERYQIAPGTAELERVRVWETANSWAEYSE